MKSSERLHKSGYIRDSGDELEIFFEDTGLSDLHYSGNVYTWTNGHVSCKLDRAIVNNVWSQCVEDGYAQLLAQGVAYHCRVLVYIGQ